MNDAALGLVAILLLESIASLAAGWLWSIKLAIQYRLRVGEALASVVTGSCVPPGSKVGFPMPRALVVGGAVGALTATLVGSRVMVTNDGATKPVPWPVLVGLALVLVAPTVELIVRVARRSPWSLLPTLLAPLQAPLLLASGDDETLQAVAWRWVTAVILADAILGFEIYRRFLHWQ